MPLSAGTRFGSYEIGPPLGAGGMGEVYRARDSKLGRDVALKVLPAALAADPEGLARLQREAQVLASLNHPNIAHIYGLEERALVMELVEGPTLAERISAGPMPLDEVMNVAKQIVEALECAHEQGIVHRDLKPANVKVRSDGTVKVLDFGLAKAMDKAADKESSTDISQSPTMSLAATGAGIILGTAAYMSPEQAVGRSVDRRSDIWSFGVVLWEMLTGSRMFEGETVSHTMADVLRAEIDLSRLPAGTPAVLRELVRRCLDRNVKTRLQAIGEARIAIERHLADPSGAEQTVAPAPARGTHAWIGWAAAGALAVVAVLLANIHFREAPPAAQVTRFLVDPPDGGNFQGAPALSPDGRKLAFIARGKDRKIGLWIRAMDSLAAYPLPGTELASNPFWSPDSKTIAFFADDKLKRIEASGGPAITLCDASTRSATGSWSREGVIVFNPNQRSALHRVAAAGGVSTPATALESKDQEFHTHPWFLPDGDHFLYMARTPENAKVRVASLKASGKDARDVMETANNVSYAQGHLLFSRETTLMAQPFDLKRFALAGEAVPVAEQVRSSGRSRTSYFSISENGQLAYQTGDVADTQLAWVDRTGKLLERIGEPGILGRLHMSRDGKIAAVSVLDKTAKTFDVWLYDLTRKLGSRFTLDSAHDEDSAMLFPDGATVVFSSDRKQKGVFDLYRKASNGSGTEELLFADGQRHSPEGFSPDGKFLLCGTGRGQGAIMALPLTGEAKPFTFAEGSNAQFSPDGRWVAYQAGERGGARSNIFVAPFPGPGGQRQVSTSGGALARWRADGKELFYVEAGQLMAVEINAKGSALEFGKPQALFEPIRLGFGPSYDVSPDGKRFLVIQNPERAEGDPLTVVQNWVTALRR